MKLSYVNNPKPTIKQSIEMDFTSDIAPPSPEKHAQLSDISRDSSPSSELLTENEKKRLQLQEMKENLLKEREALWDEEVSLRRELDSLERERFMQGLSSDSSDFDSDEEEEEVAPNINDNDDDIVESNEEMDDNAAKIFLDLMLLSSMKQLTVEPRPKPIHITGTSSLQEELSVKYDTLPLLNMKLRLRYLQKYLYPFVNLRIHNLDEEDDNRYEVIAKFKRSSKLPFQIKFKIDYDTKEDSNGQLNQFKILEISRRVRLCFERILYDNGTLLIENPVTLLFFCLEFDRLTHTCDTLITLIRNKFQNRLRYTEDIEDLELKHIKFQELKQPSEKEFIIKFEIVTDKSETHFNSQKMVMLLNPQLKIDLTLRHKGKEIKDPDINTIFEQLLPDYELDTALIDLISNIMFV